VDKCNAVLLWLFYSFQVNPINLECKLSDWIVILYGWNFFNLFYLLLFFWEINITQNSTEEKMLLQSIVYLTLKKQYIYLKKKLT
jgi:hypothetical protein